MFYVFDGSDDEVHRDFTDNSVKLTQLSLDAGSTAAP